MTEREKLEAAINAIPTPTPEPTVGRIVHYHPSTVLLGSPMPPPQAGIITYVHGGEYRAVALEVFGFPEKVIHRGVGVQPRPGGGVLVVAAEMREIVPTLRGERQVMVDVTMVTDPSGVSRLYLELAIGAEVTRALFERGDLRPANLDSIAAATRGWLERFLVQGYAEYHRQRGGPS